VGPPGLGRDELAASFADPAVARAYRHRPPYPPEALDVLERLITDRPRTVLDLGAGEGALARPLAARVDQVDALDISPAMLAAGAARPGGTHPNLRWILGAAQSAELGGPYALVTAGASLHWMPWRRTLGRLAEVLTEHAFLVIVEHGYTDEPWREELTEIIVAHSRNPGYEPGSSLPGELSAHGLLEIAGQTTTAPVPFRQAVADYVEHFHSTASLARTLMPAAESAAFDHAVGQMVGGHAVAGILELTVTAHLTWGRPVRGGASPGT
jgi:ubiquinone/menaquinone biosynthesis C-methylase UbiE